MNLLGGFLTTNNQSIIGEEFKFSDTENKLIKTINGIKNIQVPKNTFSKEFVINFFKLKIIKEKFNLNEGIINIIICDINKNDEKIYNTQDITERLKKLILENLELYDNKLNNLILNLLNNNTNNILPSYTELKLINQIQILIQNIKKMDLTLEDKRKEFNNLFKQFYNIDSKIIECIKINLNLLNTYYIEEKKKYLDSKNYVFNLKDVYLSVFSKLIPLYNISILETKSVNYILYLELDNQYYELEKKIVNEQEEIKKFIINKDYEIREIDNLNPINKIIDKNIYYHNRILTQKKGEYLKNIYMIDVDYENIFKPYGNFYTYCKKNNLINLTNLIEYQYIWIDTMGYFRPKKFMINNILNIFVYSGNLDLMYNLFGSSNKNDLNIELINNLL